jgi:hypothetical protein
MIITSEQIREELESMWDSWDLIWLTDQSFNIPTFLELEKMVQTVSVSEIKYVSNKQECEEFALYLVCNIRRERNIDNADKFNWPFGLIFGLTEDYITNEKIPHYWNICRTEDKWWQYIEPQTNKIWNMKENILTPLRIKI